MIAPILNCIMLYYSFYLRKGLVNCIFVNDICEIVSCIHLIFFSNLGFSAGFGGWNAWLWLNLSSSRLIWRIRLPLILNLAIRFLSVFTSMDWKKINEKKKQKNKILFSGFCFIHSSFDINIIILKILNILAYGFLVTVVLCVQSRLTTRHMGGGPMLNKKIMVPPLVITYKKNNSFSKCVSKYGFRSLWSYPEFRVQLIEFYFSLLPLPSLALGTNLESLRCEFGAFGSWMVARR